MNRYLLTGAAGFVGANLCRRLLDRGETQVHILIRPDTRTWRLDDVLNRLHVHHVDMTDEAGVRALVQKVRPNVIYHLATHGAYHYQDNADKTLRTNVLGLWNLIQACNDVGYDLFVNTGSSSEYGVKQFAMRETDAPDPTSFYAVAKAAQSLLCQHVGRSGDRAIITLRLFSAYGPYEEPTRLIPNLAMSALERRPIDMVSPETVRDFVYVDDVVDAYLEVDKLKQLRGEILNVGTGVQTSLRQLVSRLEAVHGAPIHARWGQMEARTWDTNVWVADVSKLRRAIGSVPSTTVSEGLTRCLPWFHEHRALYAR